LIQQVKIHVDRFRQLTLPQKGRMTQVIAEHELIMAAIEAHDPASAGTAMDKHLERLLGDISAAQTVNPEYFDQQR
jgi:DNA-binding GntR family transcriptional regulator